MSGNSTIGDALAVLPIDLGTGRVAKMVESGVRERERGTGPRALTESVDVSFNDHTADGANM